MPLVKIAYILLWFPEPTQTFILDEVNTMHRQGLKVEVFTLYGPRPPARLAGMARPEIPVHHLGLKSLGLLGKELLRVRQDKEPGAGRFLARVLLRRWRSLETMGEAAWAALAGVHLGRRLRKEGFSHIHAPWANGPATAAWVASHLSGLPFSFCAHAHDLYPPDGALMEKLTAAAFVRAISNANLRFMAELAPAAAAKLVKISYGSPLTAAESARPRRPEPPYQLLALGRLIEKKGFTVLLAACRDLAAAGLEFRLTLAGDGPQRRLLGQLAQEYGLQEKVKFPGFVPHRQVPELLRQADVFVMPCRIDPSGDRDGLPNVILEAMSHGVPVVATDVNGINEAIRPGETGWLLHPDDPQTLAQAVREALDHPDEARRRGQAGRRLVTEEFLSEKNYGRLKTYLEQFSCLES